MKHLLLIYCLFAWCFSFSQMNPCTPDVSLQDSTFGLWPDTIENLPTAVMNVYYEEHIQIKTPNTVGDVLGDPYTITFAGFPINIAPFVIDSIKLVDIQGLPSIMSTYLSDSDSVLSGNTTECVTLFGTPTSNDLGQHDLSLVINGWISIGTTPVSLYEQLGEYETIDGYKFIVMSSASVDKQDKNQFFVNQNTPNPFHNKTSIDFHSPQSKNYDFVMLDIMGRVVHTETIPAFQGLNKISIKAIDYNSGIYFYSLSDGQDIITKKLTILDR